MSPSEVDKRKTDKLSKIAVILKSQFVMSVVEFIIWN